MKKRSCAVLAGSLGLCLLVSVAVASAQQPTVTCESVNGARSYCPAETAGGVTLVRQLSSVSCDKSWGWDDKGIWVDNGCRAEFQVGGGQDRVQAGSSLVGDLLGAIAGRGSSQPTQEGVILCESVKGKRAYCEADTSAGVELVRQLSKSDCLENQSWGFDQKGIWVDRGCRGHFKLLVQPDQEEEGTEEPVGEVIITCGTSSGRTYCPADTSGGVRLVRQLSTASCTRAWGYDHGGIWTDYGCRAEFAVTGAGDAASPEQERRLICRSQSNRRSFCGADTTGGVRLARQLSTASCTRSWGWDQAGVWVDNGCEAEFLLGEGTAEAAEQRQVVCESRDGRLAFCGADTSQGVQLLRQLDSTECSGSWGWNIDGIWVDKGCRAEFELEGEAWDTDHVVVVVCESRGGGRAFCGVDASHGGRLRKQLSSAPCTRHWGWLPDGIWVDEGCKAEFEVRVPVTLSETGPTTVTCKSRLGSRSRCAADTSAGVRLATQLSTTNCMGKWGYDAEGIWVENGCWAEFELGTR